MPMHRLIVNARYRPRHLAEHMPATAIDSWLALKQATRN